MVFFCFFERFPICLSTNKNIETSSGLCASKKTDFLSSPAIFTWRNWVWSFHFGWSISCNVVTIPLCWTIPPGRGPRRSWFLEWSPPAASLLPSLCSQDSPDTGCGIQLNYLCLEKGHDKHQISRATMSYQVLHNNIFSLLWRKLSVTNIFALAQGPIWNKKKVCKHCSYQEFLNKNCLNSDLRAESYKMSRTFTVHHTRLALAFVITCFSDFFDVCLFPFKPRQRRR